MSMKHRIQGLLAAILISVMSGTALAGCSSTESTAGTAQTEAGADTAAEQSGNEASAVVTAGNGSEAGTGTGEAAGTDAATGAAEETPAGETPAAPTAYEPAEPSQVRVGIVLNDAFDEDRADYRETLLKELAAKGFDPDKMTVLDGDEGGAEAAVHRLLEDGTGFLIVEAGDDEDGQEKLDAEIGRIADAAAKAFVPVIFIWHAPSQKEMLRWKVMGYAAVALGSDCGGTGRDQAALLWSLGRKNRDLDDDAHLRYVYVGEGEAWEKDSHRVLEEELQKKGIRTECVAELKDGKGLEAALTEQLNARGKALELVVCSGDDIAEDIPEIAERAGRVPGRDLVIIGAGADDDVLGLIIKGKVTGTVYRDVLTESKSVASAAAQLCALEIPDNAVVPGISVTSVNAQEIRDYRESFLRSK